jgi:hypothetical protein
VALSLPAGSYLIRARTAPLDGRTFSWSIPITVKGASKQSIDLTNANASADSMVVASAPPVAQPAPSVQPKQNTVAIAPAKNPPAPTKQPAPVPIPTKEPERQIASKPAVVEPTPTPNVPAQPSPFEISNAPKPEPRVAAPAPVRHVEQPHARSHTSGFFLGLGLNGSSIQSDDLTSNTESGGGLAGELGYGFTRHFAMFVNASAARISSTTGDFDLGHFDVGARWNFASPSRSIAPFLDVAVGGRAAVENDVVLYDEAGQMHQGDLSITGTGLSFGGGLNYFVSPSWALGGALKYTIGEFSRVQFDKVSVDGFAIDATSARFNLGFTWFPGGR